jgi:hypothetical protein
LGVEIKKMAGTGEGSLRRDKDSPPLETRPRQKGSVLIGFKTCNKTYTAIGEGVQLGGEIRKVVGTGEGRLRRDKYSPPLKMRLRQNPDAPIGFKTCNKTCKAVGRGIRKQVIGMGRLG